MARSKKSRTMRGKLGKTGTKEMMKEQRKAQKSKEPRRFHVKKAHLRKEQAQKKLTRLGLLPEVQEAKPTVRPRRFTFVAPVTEVAVDTVIAEEENQTDELTTNDLMNAFSESF
ncbi:hypothetical protein O1D97_11455 [Marinomonas sp. 15G1-11]|uniref:Uncharacterized protein n=1 Tax=Marinomonas phaeophyticola TaxID=3004091 RepID=A0ABT4JVY6_9GAMM|nr:hypothetical protein [Marinomonas sp. 15G1-11]MCZ2722237.1 hypothetical protein [Marinomonas sp. 15G1-11]